MIEFKLETVTSPNTGASTQALVKYDGSNREEWGTVDDFDQLFDCCVRRWGKNWDLEKVKTAITESEID